MSRSPALPRPEPEPVRSSGAGWLPIATPLVEIDHPDLGAGQRLFAKLESVQAGGSIKDRPVSFILRRGLAEGKLLPGRRLLDSSSGNAGIAYAMIGALLGVPVTIVVPGNASRERLDRMRSHGAELIVTDPLDGYDEAIHTARRLAREEPERYWYADQYSNDANWRAHYETTGAEILEQVRSATGGTPDLFVSGIGTGGTLTGVGRRLREASPRIEIAAVVPELFPGIEGLKPLGHPGDLVPEILDESLVGDRLEVRTEEALEACHGLARRGYLVGPSSGANLVASLRIAARRPVRTLVTVFSDTGERYGSTGMWSTGDSTDPGDP